MGRHLFSSESVTAGHPDKIADQISDAILDHLLAGDPGSRVACECLITTGMVLVAGEITTETRIDVPEVVRATLESIGYNDAAFGIDAATCAVITTLDRQSPLPHAAANPSVRAPDRGSDKCLRATATLRAQPWQPSS